MRFKIHFTQYDSLGHGTEDYAVIDGETIEEVKVIVKDFESIRGLDPEKNNMWSEQID